MSTIEKCPLCGYLVFTTSPAKIDGKPAHDYCVEGKCDRCPVTKSAVSVYWDTRKDCYTVLCENCKKAGIADGTVKE